MPEPSKGRLAPNTLGLGVLLAIFLGGFSIWRCSQSPSETKTAGDSIPPSANAPPPESKAVAPSVAPGLSAPIAAAHVAGDVIVAGLDAPSKAIRVQRINAKDEIVADRVVLSDVASSTDSDLKVVAASEGVAVTWRGLRAGNLVRQLVLLGSDLAPKGDPTEVAAASCATRDAVWFSDGAHAVARPWSGASMTLQLPKEKDASLLCGHHRAFAVLEDEDSTSVLALGSESGAPVTMMRENDFGEDDQRELSEYTVGDDVGFVRLASSGALAIREVVGGRPGPLHKLKNTIRRDDDVVAVDASSRVVVIVYTQDVSDTAPATGADSEPNAIPVCTKVGALRVDRQSLEESVIELSPGRCGHEVGPFFTSSLGEGVSVAWTERTSGAGRPRAPIVGLAHALVAPTGSPVLARIDQASDALVDAGCDATGCYAAALARREPTAPGVAKILRYK